MNYTRKLIISLVLLICNVSILHAEEIFYKDVTKKTDQYDILIEDIVAVDDYVKFKVNINNKTSDFMHFDATKCVFKYSFGAFSPEERILIIEPHGERSRVLDVKREEGFLTDKFKFKFKGVSIISADSGKIETQDFQLPASKNEISNGPFEIELKRSRKVTDKTKAIFQVTYTGDQVGVIEPDLPGIKTEKDNIYASEQSGNKITLLFPGDDDRLRLTFSEILDKDIDMQFAKLWIVWRETFREVAKKPLMEQVVTIEKKN